MRTDRGTSNRRTVGSASVICVAHATATSLVYLSRRSARAAHGPPAAHNRPGRGGHRAAAPAARRAARAAVRHSHQGRGGRAVGADAPRRERLSAQRQRRHRAGPDRAAPLRLCRRCVAATVAHSRLREPIRHGRSLLLLRHPASLGHQSLEQSREPSDTSGGAAERARRAVCDLRRAAQRAAFQVGLCAHCSSPSQLVSST